MSLLDKLVNSALFNQPSLSSLRVVVEKEILHHDILRILNQNNLLKDLTFIGGTCLRSCYGGLRLSEDLDFTGGEDFTKESLSQMAELLTASLNEKYGLVIDVSEPIKDNSNVQTWKIKIITQAKQKYLPSQKIHIDICAIPSYEKVPKLLLNPYGIDLGTNGLIIQAQSREELFVDKLVAFALRPNRIKHRDLWDILWLHQNTVKPSFHLLQNKVLIRKITINNYLKLFKERVLLLKNDPSLLTEYKNEMLRFLPNDSMNLILNQTSYWPLVSDVLHEYLLLIEKTLQ